MQMNIFQLAGIAASFSVAVRAFRSLVREPDEMLSCRSMMPFAQRREIIVRSLSSLLRKSRNLA